MPPYPPIGGIPKKGGVYMGGIGVWFPKTFSQKFLQKFFETVTICHGLIFSQGEF